MNRVKNHFYLFSFFWFCLGLYSATIVDLGGEWYTRFCQTHNAINFMSAYQNPKRSILDTSGKTVDQGKYVVTGKKGKVGWKLNRDI
jgi:hypothetical protein